MKKQRVILATLAVSSVVAGAYVLGTRDTEAATTAAAESAAEPMSGERPARDALSASPWQPPGPRPDAMTALASHAPTIEPPPIERGVKYVPLAQQRLPAEWKAHLQTQLDNLRVTGSLNGGRITHEFALLGPLSETLQKKGLSKLLAQLAVEPTDLRAVLGPSYVVIGADVQGKWVEKRGALGFFQILRSVSGNQMVELSENQLDVLGGDGTVVASEFQNDKVGEFPATLERLTDSNGARLHNLQWIAKDRTFHLTARNMDAEEVRQLATAITQQFEAMRFGGWKDRYEYDPENLLHRLNRPGANAQGRW